MLAVHEAQRHARKIAERGLREDLEVRGRSLVPPLKFLNSPTEFLGSGVVSVSLGPKLGPRSGIYNRATYTKEMREALERWADHVQAITT
jgi:hypothetical protein